MGERFDRYKERHRCAQRGPEILPEDGVKFAEGVIHARMDYAEDVVLAELRAKFSQMREKNEKLQAHITELEMQGLRCPGCKLTSAQQKEIQERGVAYVRYLRKQRDELRYRVRGLHKQIKDLRTEIVVRDQQWRQRDGEMLRVIATLQTRIAESAAANVKLDKDFAEADAEAEILSDELEATVKQ